MKSMKIINDFGYYLDSLSYQYTQTSLYLLKEKLIECIDSYNFINIIYKENNKCIYLFFHSDKKESFRFRIPLFDKSKTSEFVIQKVFDIIKIPKLKNLNERKAYFILLHNYCYDKIDLKNIL